MYVHVRIYTCTHAEFASNVRARTHARTHTHIPIHPHTLTHILLNAACSVVGSMRSSVPAKTCSLWTCLPLLLAAHMPLKAALSWRCRPPLPLTKCMLYWCGWTMNFLVRVLFVYVCACVQCAFTMERCFLLYVTDLVCFRKAMGR
jgi:hypothetical protein